MSIANSINTPNATGQSGAQTYAADAVGTDTYAATLSPVPPAYVNGMVVYIKVQTANTGPATMDLNSLGPIAINKAHDAPLDTGDIEANQIITLVYNSTGPKFQMSSQVASGSSSGKSMVTTIVVTHAFSVGDWVYLNGSTWTLASNAAVASAEKVGYISAISTTVSFSLQMGGLITTGLAGLTAGQVSFLGTGGAATVTEPTAVGTVSLPLFVAISTTEAVILPYRGELIATAAVQAYDMPFNAGFTSAGVKEDCAVQVYGQMCTGRVGTFTGQAGYADTAPTGANLILDIKKNGTSIYSTLPEFDIASQTLDGNAVIKSDGTEDFVASDRITFEITQIGSTEPGEGIRFTALATSALI